MGDISDVEKKQCFKQILQEMEENNEQIANLEREINALEQKKTSLMYLNDRLYEKMGITTPIGTIMCDRSNVSRLPPN